MPSYHFDKIDQRYYWPTTAFQQTLNVRRFHITIGLLSVATIFWGAGYAVGRERLRSTDTHTLYQRVNAESFGGHLPDVQVEWGEPGEGNYGMTYFYDDGAVEIAIDWRTVKTEQKLLETMRHEACHVATHAEVERLHQDDHGELWQACMSRFKDAR